MPRKPKPLSAPGVPTGLTATPGNMLINLAWNAPASNGGSAITAYRLYRNDQLWHQTTGARFYLDNTSLVAGTQYRYRVSAVNAINEGLKSAEVSVTAINTNPPPVYTAPGAPASLTATGGNGLVNLTWTPPVSNGGTAITNYRVYRNGSSLIVLGNVLTYQNTGLSNGIPYSYQVAAINAAALEGPQSVSKTATPGDVTLPIVSGVTHDSVTQTTARVSWSINEPATGQVEYGPTIGYGSTSTLETDLLLGHTQNLSLLTPGTVYHYRAKSLDEAGNPGYSSDRQFQTAAGLRYGPAVGYETKANERLDGNKQSCRFRASAATITSVAVNQRFGSGYSLGNGGTVRLSIQYDSGGVPSGTILGSVTFTPGNPAGEFERKSHYALTTSPLLSVGALYHLVAENTYASPAANYISMNYVLAWNPQDSARQPAFSDDFAVLRKVGAGSWAVQSYIPVFDIAYAGGVHDGSMYFAVITGYEAYISGTSQMVRARFQVSGGTRTVSGAFIQVRRNSGSADLVVRLEQGDGTLIEAVTIPGSSIAVVAATDVMSPVAWTAVPFTANRSLTNGAIYNLRLSCVAGTTYSVMPLRWNDSADVPSYMGSWDGYHFRDGAGNGHGSSGQKTTDGGSTWNDLYAPDSSDFGWYMGVV